MVHNEADVAVVCIDVANVARDPALPGVFGLQRVDLMVEAWRSQISQHAEALLIADRSLLRNLPRVEKRRVKHLRRRNELMVTGDADELLLELAESHKGCVLSRDRFLDKRRGRHWIPQRFFTWQVGEGDVRIMRHGSRNTQPFDISRKEQQKLLQKMGIPDLRHPVARRRWTCSSDVPCPTREATPDFLQVLPMLEYEKVLCPGCHRPLQDLGPRPAQAELKLVVNSVVISRFMVEQGETIPFGRMAMPDSLAVAELAWKGAFNDVGRVHADLRLSGGRLAVRPVDEDHPVRVRQWESKTRLFSRERRLRYTDGFTAINLRDTLLFGTGLELHRSGRSIAEAEALDKAESSAAWRRRKTAK